MIAARSVRARVADEDDLLNVFAGGSLPGVIEQSLQSLATGAVFAACDGAFSLPTPWVEPVATVSALAVQLAAFRNDLEPAARHLLPEIGDVMGALSATEGCLLARMSGSGATCFGLYVEESAARAAAAAIQAQRPAWWVAAASILGRTGGPESAGQ